MGGDCATSVWREGRIRPSSVVTRPAPSVLRIFLTISVTSAGNLLRGRYRSSIPSDNHPSISIYTYKIYLQLIIINIKHSFIEQNNWHRRYEYVRGVKIRHWKTFQHID